MPPTEQLIALEAATRDWLARHDLPAPDEVRYREVSIVLLWHDRRLALAVYLDPARREPRS